MSYQTVLKEIFIEDVVRIVWDYVLKPSNRIAYMFGDNPFYFSHYPDVIRMKNTRSINGIRYHFILYFWNGSKWYWFPNEGGEGRVFEIEKKKKKLN